MFSHPELQGEQAAGCLVVTATGRYLVERKEAAFKAIAFAAKEVSAKAVLVDLRNLKGPYTFLDRYQLGEMAGQHLAFLPVASLVRENDVDPGEIGKLVANNRGAQVEIFTDEAAAYVWLKEYQTTA
jgi:hypothetical protein